MKPAISGYDDAMNALVKARADLEAKTKVDPPSGFGALLTLRVKPNQNVYPLTGSPRS